MARKTTTKRQAAPAQDDSPTYTFEGFSWVPDNFPNDSTVHARELSDLVDNVRDATMGAELVFALISAQGVELEHGNTAYLNPYQISVLSRLAMRSLHELDKKAEGIAERLHKLARGES